MNIINKEKYKYFKENLEVWRVTQFWNLEESCLVIKSWKIVQMILQHKADGWEQESTYFQIYMSMNVSESEVHEESVITDLSQYKDHWLELISTEVQNSDTTILWWALIVSIEFKRDKLIHYLSDRILGYADNVLFPHISKIVEHIILWIKRRNYESNMWWKGIPIRLQDIASNIGYEWEDYKGLWKNLVLYLSIEQSFSGVSLEDDILYINLDNQVYRTAVNVWEYIDSELGKDNVLGVEAERKEWYTLLKVKRFYNKDHRFIDLKNEFPHSDIETQVYNWNISWYYVTEKQRITKTDWNIDQ